jgi:hypothetical protein
LFDDEEIFLLGYHVVKRKDILPEDAAASVRAEAISFQVEIAG